MLVEWLTILSLKAASEDITNQITKNSMDMRLNQKYSSNTISQIHDNYNYEEDMVRDEINNLDDKTGDEYQELMEELQELKENEDQEVKTQEESASDYETIVQLENDTLETRKESIDQNIESLEEVRNKNIEKNFGYFQ